MVTIALLLVLTILFGCSSDNNSTTPSDRDATNNSSSTPAPAITNDDVRDEFIRYMKNGVIPLADDELEIINLYSNHTGENFTSDEDLYNVLLDEVIPRYTEFEKSMNALFPKTDTIRKLHQSYLDAISIQHNAFTTMLSALENQDMSQITDANNKLSEARKLIRDWNYQAEDIKKEYSISDRDLR
jgi:hypothetical protein